MWQNKKAPPTALCVKVVGGVPYYLLYALQRNVTI